jgi:single-strand DNA-binding protein
MLSASDILGIQPLENIVAQVQTPVFFGSKQVQLQTGAEGAALMAGKSVNKVILIGNLGKDPEVKYTPSGTPVAKFTLATNERFKDKEGQWQDRTEWHNITAWARTAEIAGEYLKKGGKVYIEGSLRTHSWDDKQTGQKKYMTEIVVNDLVLLGGRGEAGSGGGDHSTASRTAGNNFDQRAPEPEMAPASTPISDEDIPF